MPLGDFTSWFDQPLSPLYYNADHLAWRDTLRRFVDTEGLDARTPWGIYFAFS